MNTQSHMNTLHVTLIMQSLAHSHMNIHLNITAFNSHIQENIFSSNAVCQSQNNAIYFNKTCRSQPDVLLLLSASHLLTPPILLVHTHLQHLIPFLFFRIMYNDGLATQTHTQRLICLLKPDHIYACKIHKLETFSLLNSLMVNGLVLI